MKKFLIYATLSTFLLSPFQVLAEPASSSPASAPPAVTAPSAILIDAKSGKVLFERNADEKRFPASTTKIMTGLLAVEHGKLEEVVTIGTNPPLVERGSSQIYLIPDEQLTFEQLLYALMLESANDAAVAIAEHVSGSVEAFADLMNKRARELKAYNTNFVNPNGLHKDNHYTTARDLALIAQHAMTLPKFREVVKTVKYTIPATNKQDTRDYITNSNKLIWKTYDKYRYEHATGIKTGYTVKSKHCLVGGALKGDMELISVVLGAEGQYMYTDTMALFEYGFANYKNVSMLKKDQIVTTVTLKDAEEKINLTAAEDFHILLKNTEEEKVVTKISTRDNIVKPVKKGEALGSISFFLNDQELKKVALLSSMELSLPPAKKASNWWLWLIPAFLLYRTVVTISKLRKRRLKKRSCIIRR